MSQKRKILIQLDTDEQPSAFDRVVAVDAGVDELFSYGGVKPEHVQGLIHGAIFTRGPKDLKSTAVFIGGSDVSAGEALLAEARTQVIPSFKLTVSMMLDSNGSNTTAAAAVRAAARHIDLASTPTLVLGGTGPVGQRVAQLVSGAGSPVRLASRRKERAERVCNRIRAVNPKAQVEPYGIDNETALGASLQGQVLIIAAGAAGVQLLPMIIRKRCDTLKVAIDLNAMPPVGLEGVEVMDQAEERDGVIVYGAIGVGETKMKAHMAALRQLFESNDLVLDIKEIYQIACDLP